MMLFNIVLFCIGWGITISNSQETDYTALATTTPDQADEGKRMYDMEYGVLKVLSPDHLDYTDTILAFWERFTSNAFEKNGVKLHNMTDKVDESMSSKNFTFFFTISITSFKQLTKTRNAVSRRTNFKLVYGFQDNYNHLAAKVRRSWHWIYLNLERLKFIIDCAGQLFIDIHLTLNDWMGLGHCKGMDPIEYFSTELC